MKKLLSLALIAALLLGLAACGQRPSPVNAPLSLGEKYLLDLDYENALVELEEALKIDPKNPRIQILIEYIYVIVNDDRADPENSDLVQNNPDLFPVIPLKPADEPSRVNWLLALIGALQKLNIRDLAFELLKRLAAQFPTYEQVIGTYHVLAGELGIAVDTSVATTTAVATTVTTSAATTTALATTAAITTQATTTSRTTTTQRQSSGVELSNYMDRNGNFTITGQELANLLGVTEITHSVAYRYYRSSDGKTEIQSKWADHSIEPSLPQTDEIVYINTSKAGVTVHGFGIGTEPPVGDSFAGFRYKFAGHSDIIYGSSDNTRLITFDLIGGGGKITYLSVGPNYTGD